VLVIDNADILMMQNWEHVTAVLEHMHLQPKKSHEVDFSRVRNWLLDGHGKYYMQTLIFSRVPAPPINNIFNKHCFNYSGKCELNVLKCDKYKLGSICKIGFQLAQMFHRIECDSPIDLPKARFDLFVEKVAPPCRLSLFLFSHFYSSLPLYK
jgi:U3 small nucleolar RNA-associated protein 25